MVSPRAAVKLNKVFNHKSDSARMNFLITSYVITRNKGTEVQQ